MCQQAGASGDGDLAVGGDVGGGDLLVCPFSTGHGLNLEHVRQIEWYLTVCSYAFNHT